MATTVFKGNYLFRTWTDASPSSITWCLPATTSANAKSVTALTRWKLLDSCHALMNYGVDRYKRGRQAVAGAGKTAPRSARERSRLQVNDLWRTIPRRQTNGEASNRAFSGGTAGKPAVLHRENPLLLEPWQREVVRIVRKGGAVFLSAAATQVMNEGWATFWHYTLLNRLYEKAW